MDSIFVPENRSWNTDTFKIGWGAKKNTPKSVAVRKALVSLADSASSTALTGIDSPARVQLNALTRDYCNNNSRAHSTIPSGTDNYSMIANWDAWARLAVGRVEHNIIVYCGLQPSLAIWIWFSWPTLDIHDDINWFPMWSLSVLIVAAHFLNNKQPTNGNHLWWPVRADTTQVPVVPAPNISGLEVNTCHWLDNSKYASGPRLSWSWNFGARFSRAMNTLASSTMDQLAVLSFTFTHSSQCPSSLWRVVAP